MYVVTGGSSGIGAALALGLANQGYDVLIVGRRAPELLRVASQSSLIQTCCADVSTIEGRAVVVEALETKQSLTGLIHNAGIIDPIAAIADIHLHHFHQLMATNLEAPFFLTQALLAKLSNARILCIGSGAAHFPVAGWSLYCMSKAALKMMVECWQLEYPQLNIASVMPGIVDTPMQDLIRASTQGMHPEKKAFFETLHRENKLLSVQDVTSFLLQILLKTNDALFRSKEWDIYET